MISNKYITELCAKHGTNDFLTAYACEMYGVTADKVTPELRNKAKAASFHLRYGTSGRFSVSKPSIQEIRRGSEMAKFLSENPQFLRRK